MIHCHQCFIISLKQLRVFLELYDIVKCENSLLKMLNDVHNNHYFINFFKHMINFSLEIFKIDEQKFLIFIFIEIFMKH